MKDAVMIKFKDVLIQFYLNTNLDLIPVMIHTSLVVLIQKWKKKIVDKGGIFGSFLTEVWFFIGSFLTRIYYYIIHSFLSKTFDCLSYELLKTQQHAYEYDKRSLLLICNYLSNLKQRVEIFIILGVKSYLKFHKDP